MSDELRNREYQVLKQEMYEDCTHYEQSGYASPQMLARANEVSVYLHDKLYFDTLNSDEAQRNYETNQRNALRPK